MRIKELKNRFSEILRSKANDIWIKIFSHPFLKEIGSGRLPLDKFVYYVKQDYSYLIEFARCLGIATAKVEDHTLMSAFASLLNTSLTVEMKMLRDLAKKLSITKELETVEMAPTNVAYTRHLLYVAYSGTVAEILAAMLPCMWLYQEIGEKLCTKTELRKNTIFSEWLDTYTSENYLNLVIWYKDLVDRFALESMYTLRNKMVSHFILSSRYEYLFWDMAYKKETWLL
jgi:thiaminase/transcriptional activator TenA